MRYEILRTTKCAQDHGLETERVMNHYGINELLPRLKSGNYKSWWFQKYSYVLNGITSCWLEAVCHYFSSFFFLESHQLQSGADKGKTQNRTKETTKQQNYKNSHLYEPSD